MKSFFAQFLMFLALESIVQITFSNLNISNKLWRWPQKILCKSTKTLNLFLN